jgi:hypothetical protein
MASADFQLVQPCHVVYAILGLFSGLEPVPGEWVQVNTYGAVFLLDYVKALHLFHLRDLLLSLNQSQKLLSATDLV